jgi:hypothetical protein
MHFHLKMPEPLQGRLADRSFKLSARLLHLAERPAAPGSKATYAAYCASIAGLMIRACVQLRSHNNGSCGKPFWA